MRHRVLRRRAGRAAGPAGALPAGPQAGAGRRPAAGRRLVRARSRARGAQRRTHALAQRHGGLGAAEGELGAGDAVPAVHGPMAGRQGPAGRDDHNGARPALPAGSAPGVTVETPVALLTATAVRWFSSAAPVGGYFGALTVEGEAASVRVLPCSPLQGVTRGHQARTARR